jgi:hypothetical protein
LPTGIAIEEHGIGHEHHGRQGARILDRPGPVVDLVELEVGVPECQQHGPAGILAALRMFGQVGDLRRRLAVGTQDFLGDDIALDGVRRTGAEA